MIKDMENQIRHVYPTGYTYEANLDEFIPDFYAEIVYGAISEITKACNVDYTDLSFLCQKSYLIVLTLNRHPNFSSWTSISFAEKKNWLQKNNNRYPLFYVRFSRVWPGYYFFYNIRKFDFERECLDTDYLEEPPDDEWSDIQGKVIEILTFPEMTHFSLQDLEEEVPFILDGEMPLSMDDEVEPTLVPAVLKQCLFDYP